MNRPAAFLIALLFLAPFMGPREASALVRTDRPHVAVFIPENLSGKPAPLRDMRESLIRGIVSMGAQVLDDAALQQYMARHRIRYIGGIDAAVALALKSEEQVDAVLISSVELYEEGPPPKIAVMSRLVSTGEQPRILWMESVAMSGDDSPGLLGVGLIMDHAALREKVVKSLVQSLMRHLAGGEAEIKPVAGRYNPKLFYRDPALSPEKRYTVAVAPFLNISGRKYAGEIMVLHFVTALVRDGKFDVVEPGLLRQKLLNVRVIMSEGITLRDADLIALSLDADLVLTGNAFEYQDFSGQMGGTPKVDFSVVVIENMSKKMVWSSRSHNQGSDGVFFFDRGQVNTAGRLAKQMTGAIIGKMSEEALEGGSGRGPGRLELPYTSRPAD